MKCFAVSHQQHACEEVEKAAKDFVVSITSRVEPFPPLISQFHKALTQVEMANKTFLKTMDRMEHEVKQRANEMKRLVDDHASKLVQELYEIKASSVKEANNRIKSLELALTALESFQAYSSEIASKGSHCDITRTADDLLAKAEELLQTHVISADYSPPYVRLVPSDIDAMTAAEKDNIVGSLVQCTCLMSFDQHILTVCRCGRDYVFYICKPVLGSEVVQSINQSINQFISRHCTQARATVRLMPNQREMFSKTDLVRQFSGREFQILEQQQRNDEQQCPNCAAELTEAFVWMIAASETDCMG